MGVLRLEPVDDEFPLEVTVANRLDRAFRARSGHGLLQLGVGEGGSRLPPALAFWREFAMRFAARSARAERRRRANTPNVRRRARGTRRADRRSAANAGRRISAPRGLTRCGGTWSGRLEIELAESGLSAPGFSQKSATAAGASSDACISISRKIAATRIFPSPSWRPIRPALAAQGALRHLPLGQALREYAGAGDKAKLLQLLAPVQQASESLRLAEDDRRRRRDFSSPALDAAGRGALPARCRGDGAGRPRHSHAGQLGA